MENTLSERRPALRLAVKAATAAAHVRLEGALGLLEPPLDRERFAAVLQGFWGFHAVWEPLAASLLAGRGKLGLLERDLAGLGMNIEAVRQLPRCGAAERLAGPVPRLLGSLYVLEGATLGGQVISRALHGQGWVPPGGLRYFAPYGAATGLMWRQFLDMLEDASSALADSEIISGALDCFAVLQDWLCGARAA